MQLKFRLIFLLLLSFADPDAHRGPSPPTPPDMAPDMEMHQRPPPRKKAKFGPSLDEGKNFGEWLSLSPEVGESAE